MPRNITYDPLRSLRNLCALCGKKNNLKYNLTAKDAKENAKDAKKKMFLQ